MPAQRYFAAEKACRVRGLSSVRPLTHSAEARKNPACVCPF